MANVKLNSNRRYKDPSKLTPYEESIFALMQQGKTPKEIAAELNIAHPRSLSTCMTTIREKVATQNDSWEGA